MSHQLLVLRAKKLSGIPGKCLLRWLRSSKTSVNIHQQSMMQIQTQMRTFSLLCVTRTVMLIEFMMQDWTYSSFKCISCSACEACHLSSSLCLGPGNCVLDVCRESSKLGVVKKKRWQLACSVDYTPTNCWELPRIDKMWLQNWVLWKMQMLPLWYQVHTTFFLQIW